MSRPSYRDAVLPTQTHTFAVVDNRSRYMKKMKSIAVLTALVVGAVAYADVIFDAATGTGFVGKGDVQLALGYNNAQLQANANSLVFAAVSTVVTERSWTCTNSNN